MGGQPAQQGVGENGNQAEENTIEVVAEPENKEESFSGNNNQAKENTIEFFIRIHIDEEGYGGNGNQSENNPLDDVAGLNNQEEGLNGLDGGLNDQVMDQGIDQLDFEEAATMHQQQYERELRIEKDGEVFDDSVKLQLMIQKIPRMTRHHIKLQMMT